MSLEDVMMERMEAISSLLNSFNQGTKPIDTIMATIGIHIRRDGYLPFGDGVGDHRPLFVDATIASTLGVRIITPRKMAA